jgi:hypothetical protein
MARCGLLSHLRGAVCNERICNYITTTSVMRWHRQCPRLGGRDSPCGPQSMVDWSARTVLSKLKKASTGRPLASAVCSPGWSSVRRSFLNQRTTGFCWAAAAADPPFSLACTLQSGFRFHIVAGGAGTPGSYSLRLQGAKCEAWRGVATRRVHHTERI